MTLEEAFWKVHSELVLQGPGSEQTATKMFELAGKPKGKALDLGSGPGRASLFLAKQGLNVTAVDLHQPFLDNLKDAAQKEGLSNKIETANISMDNLGELSGKYDLIWAEASIYNIGWQKALDIWKLVLKPGGVMVVSDCCWTIDKPSKVVKDFWAEEYPGMTSPSNIKSQIEQAGFKVLGEYTYPDSDWENYYRPIEQKLTELAALDDENVQAIIRMSKNEINMWRKYKKEFAYIGFLFKLIL